MGDTVIQIGNSQLQHGSCNDRIYLIKYDPTDFEKLFQTFTELIHQHNYSKIFIKVASKYEQLFLDDGFIREAIIPAFYDKEDCLFMGKFLKSKRATISIEEQNTLDTILQTAMRKASNSAPPTLPSGYTIQPLTEDLADQLAAIYREVFDSYPFPIFDREYLIETMQSNVDYFGAFYNGQLVAVASSEIDSNSKSAEMTDFATLPDYRGKNLSLLLLHRMEQAMKKKGIATCYTIARAISYGMNITFSKCGYRYGGTLINNTDISGKIESMNIWHKAI